MARDAFLNGSNAELGAGMTQAELNARVAKMLLAKHNEILRAVERLAAQQAGGDTRVSQTDPRVARSARSRRARRQR